jgi:hypothetical protein
MGQKPPLPSASLEALQLEIGCLGSPLKENFDKLHLLATPCWMKSLWDALLPLQILLSLDQVTGWICCNNIAALNQSSKNRKRVSARVKHSDLHCAI